jgi:glycosyltransferase domain-containing protein
MENKLTIVLTIKGRTEFTLRWMNYMNIVSCPYKILIADGGADKDIEKNLKNKKNYASLDYEYIRYPYDLNYGIFYKKLSDVIGKVSTPYMLFADNDDFFILDSLPVYIAFLDENSDYVSCGGKTAVLSLYSNENKLLNSACGDNYIVTTENSRTSSIEFDSRVKRVCYFFRNVDSSCLWTSWYNILRTNDAKLIFDYIDRYEFKDIVGLEIYMHAGMLLRGKYKGFESVHYVRQDGTSQSTNDANSEHNIIERFLTKDIFSEIFNGLCFVDNSISGKGQDRMHRAFSWWFAMHAKSIYCAPVPSIKSYFKRLFINNRSFYISHLLRRSLMWVKNLFSYKKVYFMKMKHPLESVLIQRQKNIR